MNRNVKSSALIIVLLLLSVFNNNLFSSNYFVSTSGNDDNNGSIEAPFLTLQKALNTVASGDTIFLRGGTYFNVSHQYGNNFVQNKAGTAEKPIVIMAYNEEVPILDGSNFQVTTNSDPSLAVVVMWNVKHVVVDGITIQNGKRTGIHFVGECENITVKNCTIKDCKAPGIGVGGFDAPYQLCKNVIISNNTVTNCAQTYREAISLRWVDGFEVSHNTVGNITKECIDVKSGCSNGTVFGNTIIDGGDVGIYVDAGFSNTSVLKDIRIYNNKLINPKKTAIAIASEEGNEGHSIYVYNNLICDYNKTQGVGIKVAKNSESNNDGYIHDVFIYNNTVYGRGQQGLYVNLGGVKNIVFRNNISMNNLQQMALNTNNGVDPSEVIIENNLYYGAVQYPGINAVTVTDENIVFENLQTGDLHLRENSPAIDAATASTKPETDLDGKNRPYGAGYDIGCYEYGSTTTGETFSCGENVKDNDGNIYETVRIGELCWMKSNMRTTTYSDGSKVVKSMIYSSSMHSDTNTNLATFGRLYTWYSAVNIPENSDLTPERNSEGFIQGVCPDGWHIPSTSEISSLNTNTVESLCSADFWLEPNNNNNSTGFASFPAGYYNSELNRFEGLLGKTYYWSDTSPTPELATACNINYYCDSTNIENKHSSNALSVRCVKK